MFVSPTVWRERLKDDPKRWVCTKDKSTTFKTWVVTTVRMSIVKVPLVFLASISFKQCLTPPNPAPPDSEKISGTSVYSLLNSGWYCQVVLKYATSLQVICGFIEIALILASHMPNTATSHFALHTFLFGRQGRADKLRLSPVNAVGGLMLILGWRIRANTYRYLGKFFRFEASIQKDHELIMDGPYAIVRHPSYTGLVISHFGWFLWNFGEGSWVMESGLWSTLGGKVAVVLYAVLIVLGTLYLTLTRMSSEDAALRATFGDKWDDWASQVKYLLIPGIY